jgi:hypothetical protein
MCGKPLISVMFCFLAVTNSFAFDNSASFKLAEITVRDSWPSLHPLLLGNLDNLARLAKEKIPRDISGEIFIEEMKNAFNAESFTRLLADQFAGTMTPNEIDESLAYVSSSAAKKRRAIANSFGDPKFISPITQDACSRIRVRLAAVGAIGDAALDQACPLK